MMISIPIPDTVAVRMIERDAWARGHLAGLRAGLAWWLIALAVGLVCGGLVGFVLGVGR
jgi:hypothetical protein